jgi:hypothetical protein
MRITAGNPSQPLRSVDGTSWTAAGAFPIAGIEHLSYAQFTPH